MTTSGHQSMITHTKYLRHHLLLNTWRISPGILLAVYSNQMQFCSTRTLHPSWPLTCIGQICRAERAVRLKLVGLALPLFFTSILPFMGYFTVQFSWYLKALSVILKPKILPYNRGSIFFWPLVQCRSAWHPSSPGLHAAHWKFTWHDHLRHVPLPKLRLTGHLFISGSKKWANRFIWALTSVK